MKMEGGWIHGDILKWRIILKLILVIYPLDRSSVFLSACEFLQASIHPSVHRSPDLCFDLLIYVSIPSSLTVLQPRYISLFSSPLIYLHLHLSHFHFLPPPPPFFFMSSLSIHVTFPYFRSSLCFFCPLPHIFKHAQSFYIWLFPLRSFSLSCWIMSLFVLLTFSKDISLCLVFLYSSSCAAHFSTAPSFRLSLECSSKLEHSNNLHKLLKANVVMCVQQVFCWWHVFTLLMTSGQTCHRGHHVCAGDLTVWI